MHKRLLITALILIFIAFLAAQISQRQHAFITGNTVTEEKTQDDLFQPQGPSLEQKTALQQQQKQPPRTAFGYIVRWLGV